MPDGQMEQRSKLARDFPRRIEWMLECCAAGRARKARPGVWASSLPILRGSIRQTRQDQAGCVDGVPRCRSMDPKGPSSSFARSRGLH